jgi:hypothetical protein
LINKHIAERQEKYIEKRKQRKLLSIILNKVAFSFPISPLVIIFIFQYYIWKYNK